MNILLVLLAIGGVLLVGAGIAFFLLKLGVIGYYATTGENDRGESDSYDLGQSQPPDSSA